MVSTMLLRPLTESLNATTARNDLSERRKNFATREATLMNENINADSAIYAFSALITARDTKTHTLPSKSTNVSLATSPSAEKTSSTAIVCEKSASETKKISRLNTMPNNTENSVQKSKEKNPKKNLLQNPCHSTNIDDEDISYNNTKSYFITENKFFLKS